MTWTHQICDDCWDEKNPDALSPRHNQGDLEICCWCGRENFSGIYLRFDPNSTELYCGPEDHTDRIREKAEKIIGEFRQTGGGRLGLAAMIEQALREEFVLGRTEKFKSQTEFHETMGRIEREVRKSTILKCADRLSNWEPEENVKDICSVEFKMAIRSRAVEELRKMAEEE
jgi:hypothetical protein